MQFLVNRRRSGFGGFCSQFGGVNTLQKQGSFSGSLCLNASDQVQVQRRHPSQFGSVVRTHLILLSVSIGHLADVISTKQVNNGKGHCLRTWGNKGGNGGGMLP